MLTGAGSDGAVGVTKIKEAGGIVLVQDPKEAEYGSMPRSAIATGAADLVEPLGRLVRRLEEVARSKDAHEVIGVAGSVDQALALLDELAPPPDIAIVDANLGGHSSRAVVDALHERNVRVIVASGYGATELARLGFDHPVVQKPYTPREIEAAVAGGD